MSNIDKINSIPFSDVLAKLGYYEGTGYKLQGSLIKMIDGGKITGGWNGDMNKGFLKCNSGKKPGRFEGDRISIIQDKLSLTKGEAISWYEDNFGLEKTTPNKGEATLSLKGKWNELESLSAEQIEYLNGRKINYELVSGEVRNYMGSIALPIFSANQTLCSFQGRNIDDDGKKMRYRLLPGHPAKGVFASWSDIVWSKPIFVVEGMTDYLTLRQFTAQVIGLVSKDNGVDEIKSLKHKGKFIIIPDNDEAGEQSAAKLNDIGAGILKLSLYEDDEIKDVNDLWIKCLANGMDGEMFIKMLLEDATMPKANLDLALSKAIKNRDVGSWKVGDVVFDEATGGITPGSVMIINGLSGEGKTTTLDWIITSLMKHEKRMGFCSIDDDIGKMLAMFLGRHFHKEWQTEIYPEIETYVEKYGREKFNNFLMYDDINTLEGFEYKIKEEGLDVLIIDYIQVIEGLPGKDMKDKMLNASKGLQRLAIDTHTAIICLCQVSKGEDLKPVLYRTPMESQYIKSTADTFINVGIFNGKHKIAFVKNKYGATKYKNTEFDTQWNATTGAITIWKDMATSSF